MPRRSGHWRTEMHGSVAIGAKYFEFRLPTALAGCQLKENGDSVVTVFHSSSDESVLAYIYDNQRVGDKKHSFFWQFLAFGTGQRIAGKNKQFVRWCVSVCGLSSSIGP
jgi:hypothetical protein